MAATASEGVATLALHAAPVGRGAQRPGDYRHITLQCARRSPARLTGTEAERSQAALTILVRAR